MKSKLIIITAAVILITVLILLIELYAANKEEVVHLYISEQVINARQLGREISVYLNDETQKIYSLISIFDIQNYNLNDNKGDIQKHLDADLKNHVIEESIYDEKGTVVFSTTETKIGNSYKQSDFFHWASKVGNKDKPFISSISQKTDNISAPISSFRIIIAVPVYKNVKNDLAGNSNDKFAGIVTSTIELNELIPELLTSVIPDTSNFNAFILDANGTMLLNTKHPDMDFRNANFPDKTCFNCHPSFNHIKTILSSREGSVEYALKGMPSKTDYFSSVEFNNIFWKVCLVIPSERILKPLNKNLKLTLVLIGVIIFSFSGGFILIYRGNKFKSKAEEEGRQWKLKHDLQEKILEAETQHKSVVDNAPDAIVIVCENNIVFVNPATVKLFGGSGPDDFMGKPALDFIHPDDRNLVSRRFREALTMGKILPSIEERMLRLDGSVIIVEVVSATVMYKGKTSLQSIIHNITDRKQSEREQEVLYEITLGVTKSSNLIELLKLIHQSMSKVIYANNFFVALYDKETGLFSFPYFVDKFDPTPEPAALQKSGTAYVFRTGKPLLLTEEVSRKLEELNEVQVIGSPSPSWVGIPLQTPTRIIGVLVLQHYEDKDAYTESDVKFLSVIGSQIAIIIERKMVEDALRESEIKLKVILESTADGILAVDSKGKVIQTNKRFAEIWHIPQSIIDSGDGANLLNYVLEQLINPDEFSSKAQKLYNSSKEDLGLVQFKDGRIFERYSAPLMMNDSSIGRVWSFRDVTDRQRAELEIKKHNEQLSKINSEKDKFFSIIAHDLKSPFLGFIGLTKMLSDGNEEFTKAEIMKYSENMHESASTLYKLIENLLEWSQMQRGTINFSPREFNFSDIVSQNIRIINPHARQKEITIINEVTAAENVYADEKMIDTILRNLLSNAIKFTVRNGKVIVRAKKTDCDMVEVSVCDTGVGMTEKDLNKLFKIEEKVGYKGTEGEPSTGLGLLLCKDFVEKNGGNIWAVSEEGKGSTFYFTVPAHQ